MIIRTAVSLAVLATLFFGVAAEATSTPDLRQHHADR